MGGCKYKLWCGGEGGRVMREGELGTRTSTQGGTCEPSCLKETGWGWRMREGAVEGKAWVGGVEEGGCSGRVSLGGGGGGGRVRSNRVGCGGGEGGEGG